MPNPSVLSATASAWSIPSPRQLSRPAAWLAVCALIFSLIGNLPYNPEPPEGVVAERDLVYRTVGSREVCLDLYRPAAAPPVDGWPVIVAIHGGGWRGGSKDDYGQALARLARHGLAVAAIDYRLSRPGRPSWPENRDDARAAVRWLRQHAQTLALDPDRIAALGASAGGHLAALLGTDPDTDGAARVDAVVCFYAPADLTALARVHGPDAAIATMLGAAPGHDPDRYGDASPIHHATANDPPMLLIHGDRDQTVPLDQSDRLAEALARAGVPHRRIVVQGAGHGFNLTVGDRDLLPDVLEFLKTTWDHTPEDRTVGPSRPGLLASPSQPRPHLETQRGSE